MDLEETINNPKYIAFLMDNLTLSQQESIFLKWDIKERVKMYIDFGNKISDAFSIIANSGFDVNGKKVYLSRCTIVRYYYQLK